VNVICKNDGQYAAYELCGRRLTIGGELTLCLEELQADYPVRVYVSEDERGRLVTGAARRYVAQLDIPARVSRVEKTGIADDFGFPVLRRVYETFSSDKVTLTLWRIRR
jgi:hypothetical protein